MPQPSDLFDVHSLLADMVSQHCQDSTDRHHIMSFAISTNEDAIAYLEKIGWLELVPIKTLRWRWTSTAYKERST